MPYLQHITINDGQMIKLIIIGFLVSIAVTRCRCTKYGDCFDEKYSFEIYVKAFPDLDSILINDTVWFDINEPTSLMDKNTSQVINFTNAANLGSAIAFVELLGNSQSRFAANDFHFVLISGFETNNVNPERFREYLF